MVSSPPLTTSQLFPLAFFDAQIDGLRLRANFRERVPEEELPILKFIRALDGRAVGTLRAKGNGESWKVIHRGEDLQRASHWTGADFVVILQGGKSTCRIRSTFIDNSYEVGCTLPIRTRTVYSLCILNQHKPSFFLLSSHFLPCLPLQAKST